jgi:hypothetical protein
MLRDLLALWSNGALWVILSLMFFVLNTDSFIQNPRLITGVLAVAWFVVGVVHLKRYV